jgi:hypothetical protein
MSRISRFICLLVLLACAVCLPALGAPTDQTQTSARIVTAKIKLDDLSMVIVPVSINDSGPYDFMLDTGSGKTMVDRKLADELRLAQVGEKTVVGVMASARMALVHTNSISVAGATVSGLDTFSSDRLTTTVHVRGVLGEDFLQKFDLLIDYSHKFIRLESAGGSMVASAIGERLPLELSGMYHGQPTHNRIVVWGRIDELGGRAMSLQLDSGANNLTVFKEEQSPRTTRLASAQVGNFDGWVPSFLATRSVRYLRLGNISVSNVTVIAMSRRAEVDTDGIIPTSLFRSILISHSERFAIVNPSFPKLSR